MPLFPTLCVFENVECKDTDKYTLQCYFLSLYKRVIIPSAVQKVRSNCIHTYSVQMTMWLLDEACLVMYGWIALNKVA